MTAQVQAKNANGVLSDRSPASSPAVPVGPAVAPSIDSISTPSSTAAAVTINYRPAESTSKSYLILARPASGGADTPFPAAALVPGQAVQSTTLTVGSGSGELPPGRYRFLVQASNGLTVRGAVPTTLRRLPAACCCMPRGTPAPGVPRQGPLPHRSATTAALVPPTFRTQSDLSAPSAEVSAGVPATPASVAVVSSSDAQVVLQFQGDEITSGAWVYWQDAVTSAGGMVAAHFELPGAQAAAVGGNTWELTVQLAQLPRSGRYKFAVKPGGQGAGGGAQAGL